MTTHTRMFQELYGKTVLVTGGAGFVGSNLTARLLSLGSSVICFDDLSTGSINNIKPFFHEPGFRFVPGDANVLSELSRVFEADKPIDYVYHYAARVGVLRTLERPLDVLCDIDGIKNILELSRQNGVKKVMYSSSSEVYGEPVEIPEKEDGHLNPKLPYAVVKLAGETYMKSYYQMFGLPTCSMRFFNIYGVGQDSSSYGFVASIFMKQALSGNPITIFGDGTQTRDFVHIDDNIEACLLALLSDKTNGEVLNVGTGRPVTILDLAEHVIRLVGNDRVKIEYKPPRPDGEIRHRFPDVSKLIKLVGFRPSCTLEEGLRRILAWHQQNNKLGTPLYAELPKSARIQS